MLGCLTGRQARAGEAGCGADFITIPRGRNSLAGESGCVYAVPAVVDASGAVTTPATTVPTHAVRRFCGQRLSCVTDSTVNSWVYS